ncbi:MAG: hypothetical protein ACJATA_001088 [Sphingobacteriales bacterium]|jgi:hypothetical protein
MQRLHFNNKIGAAIIGFSIIFSLFTGCKDDEEELRAIPQIAFASINPSTVTQFKDSIIIKVSFSDADGDLGYKSPDSLSVSVLDNRLTKADLFYLSPVTPDGEELKVKGNFRIKIANTFLIGNGGEEQTFYTIFVRDRAGNKSNIITTTNLTIRK